MPRLLGLDVNKLMENVEAGAKFAKEGLERIDVGAVAADARSAVESGIGKIVESDAARGVRDIASFGRESAVSVVDAVSRRMSQNDEAETIPASFGGCVSLYWLLASVDGSITDEERAVMRDLISELGEERMEMVDEIERDCVSKLSEDAGVIGLQNAAKMEARAIIEMLAPTPQEARLLCWNLLALANSDGLNDEEIDFIGYVGERSGVGEAVFRELLNYSDAIVELSRTRERFCQSKRPYNEVEPIVSEMAAREQAIIRAAQALIADK